MKFLFIFSIFLFGVIKLYRTTDTSKLPNVEIHRTISKSIKDSDNPFNATYHAGYIDVGKKGKLFYLFFESIDITDSWTVWLTGGPGCASTMAAMYENGPFRAVDSRLIRNDFPWYQDTNMLYIDQPIGTGFSYSTSFDDYAKDEEKLRAYLLSFLIKFSETEQSVNSLKLYIFGESFAGHYIPHIATEIIRRGYRKKLNFVGIGVGDGYVNPKIQVASFGDYYDQHFEPNMLSTTFNLVCNKTVSSITSCTEIAMLMLPTDTNVYNIKAPAYDFTEVNDFYNDKDVQKKLGVSMGNYSECSLIPHILLLNDLNNDTSTLFTELNHAGIRILIYYGHLDYICNYIGGRNWVSELEIKDAKKVLDESNYIPYPINGNSVKYVKFGNIIYMEYDNAGHMVPMDQPELSQLMLNDFLEDIL